MIRPMKPDDLQSVVVLLDHLRTLTPYRLLRPDWGVVLRTITECMSPQLGMVLVAEHKGALTGILIAKVQTIWWAEQRDGPRVVSDLLFHSQHYGDGGRMLRALKGWAFSLPRVVRIEMAVSSGRGTMRSMCRLYERQGFALEGTLFTLNHPKYAAMLAGASTKTQRRAFGGGGILAA